MTKLGLLGVAVAALVMLAPEAMAQRRGVVAAVAERHVAECAERW